MSIVVPAKSISILAAAKDPKQALIDMFAPALPKIEVLWNQVLVATFIRPEKTAGGIIRPQTNVSEDQWQGKVGLVLKLGTHAFDDDEENAFKGVKVNVGEWVGYKTGDAWEILVKGTEQVSCRLIRDSAIRLRVTDPEIIF